MREHGLMGEEGEEGEEELAVPEDSRSFEEKLKASEYVGISGSGVQGMGERGLLKLRSMNWGTGTLQL
jgi:hypothetical protein